MPEPRDTHRILVVDDGCIHCEGTPAEVLTPQTLRDVFGVEGRVLAGPGEVEMVIVPLGRVSQGAPADVPPTAAVQTRP